MNILRLAFKHAPSEARDIVKKINKDDKNRRPLKKLSENND